MCQLYKMTYEQFINQCKQRIIPEGIYTEGHHIIPKCKGGKKDKANIIKLTGQEHYEAHRLLALENPDNLEIQKAWYIMACGPERYKRREIHYSADDYAKLREIAAKSNKQMFGGKKLSEEHKRKMSESLKGHPTWNKGIPQTQETKDKISKKLKGKPQNWHTGHPHTEESKQKIKNALKGKKHYWSSKGQKRSEETKEKIRQNTIKQFSKSVQCVETGIIYHSRKEAAEAVGCKQQNISRAIIYPTRTAGKYHWKENDT